MALKLTIEDLFGVYVLDETRIPKKEFDLFHYQIGNIHLFLNAENSPSYRYLYNKLGQNDEWIVFENGFFSIQPQKRRIHFSILEQYQLRINQTASGYKYHTKFNPPRLQSFQLIKRKSLYMKALDREHYYIPVAQDIFARESQTIAKELLETAIRYQENWELISKT